MDIVIDLNKKSYIWLPTNENDGTIHNIMKNQYSMKESILLPNHDVIAHGMIIEKLTETNPGMAYRVTFIKPLFTKEYFDNFIRIKIDDSNTLTKFSDFIKVIRMTYEPYFDHRFKTYLINYNIDNKILEVKYVKGKTDKEYRLFKIAIINK